MNIEDFYRMEGSRLSFTRQQGSDFAKRVAGDFNPIHHPDSKRFCVPGDLLFSVIVHHYGLRQNMAFHFSGMVDDSVQLLLPECEDEHTEISARRGHPRIRPARPGRARRSWLQAHGPGWAAPV